MRSGSEAENHAFYPVRRKSLTLRASSPPPPLPRQGPTAPPSSAGSPQGPPRRELLPVSCAMVVGEVVGRVEWETIGIRIGGGGGGRRGCGSLCTQRPRLRRWRSAAAAAGAGSRGGGGGERGGAEEGRSWSEKAGRGEMGEELFRSRAGAGSGRWVCGAGAESLAGFRRLSDRCLWGVVGVHLPLPSASSPLLQMSLPRPAPTRLRLQGPQWETQPCSIEQSDRLLLFFFG